MNSYNTETIFHLPGLFRFVNIYERLLYDYKNNPQCFKDNVKIGSIYGCPNGIWNGGRVALFPHWSKTDLIKVKDLLEEYDIPARFTFTNCLLEEKHLYDTYCNMLLEIFNTGKNEIICNKEILEKYIREKYEDKYKYISSTTKRLNTEDEQTKEINKDYHLIVLDYDYNKNFNYLQSIENKDKCELLCNAICKPHCEKRCKHYEIISQCQLDFDDSAIDEFKCSNAENDNLITAIQQDNFISPEMINGFYLSMGFKNFKLEGRTMKPLDLIEVLLYYLIKDTYKTQVRMALQQTLYN